MKQGLNGFMNAQTLINSCLKEGAFSNLIGLDAGACFGECINDLSAL